MEGVLKTIVLHSNICISYAGYPKIACKIIKNFKDQLDTNVQVKNNWNPELGAHLLYQQTLKEVAGVEFILCISNEDKENPQQFIYKISREIKQSDVKDAPSAWIGNYDAFIHFQGLFHENKLRGEFDNSAFSSAFRSLITRQSIENVGDFVIHTTYDMTHGFHYSSSFSAHFSFKAPQNLEAGQEITIGMGTPENGDYHEVYFESLYLCDPAIGIFFPLGNFGIFFHSSEVLDNEGQGIIIFDVDIDGYLKTICSLYGIPMRGTEVRADGLYPIFSSCCDSDRHIMQTINANSCDRL